MFKPGRGPTRGILTNDGAAFGDGNVVVDDDRCKSHGMHALEFLRGQMIRVPLPPDNLVRDLELFLPTWVQYEITRLPRKLQKTDEQVAIESSEIVSG